MIVVFEWVPTEAQVVDYYNIVINAEDELHPRHLNCSSSPCNVTLNYGVEYTASIFSVNCIGVSSPLIRDFKLGMECICGILLMISIMVNNSTNIGIRMHQPVLLGLIWYSKGSRKR